MQQNHAKAVEEANKELELNQLKDRISQLESSLAESQRVVQVKDEAMNLACEKIIDGDCKVIAMLDEARYTTPKNLPKFVTEEEYQKALEAIDMVQSELGKQQEEYKILQEMCMQRGDKLIEANNELLRVKGELMTTGRMLKEITGFWELNQIHYLAYKDLPKRIEYYVREIYDKKRFR